MWNNVGVKVTLEPLDTMPYLAARKQGDFDGLISGNTLRFDPNDFYGRNLHSKSEYAQVMSGWQNERYDQLVEEARRTLDPARRKALYTELRRRLRNYRATSPMWWEPSRIAVA